MKRYVVIHKKIGETPLEALTSWKELHPEYRDIPATYAGRLDPMASGKLLILFGEECKKKERYTGLDKEYEVEILLDIQTDTGDMLGFPQLQGTKTVPSIKDVVRASQNLRGAALVPYPAFSSKTVNGKPLFHYALSGTLDTISIPEHIEQIYSISVLGVHSLSKEELYKRIETLLSIVPRSLDPAKKQGADFRQDAIRSAWQEVFSSMPSRSFTLVTLRVTCASATYMRTLAERLATELKTMGCALSINRSKIGRYLPVLGYWIRSYER